MRRAPEVAWWIAATVVGLSLTGLCAWFAFKIPPGRVSIRVANEGSGDFTTDLNWFWAGAAAAILTVRVIALLWRFSDLLTGRIWTWRIVRAVKRERAERGMDRPRERD